MFCHITKNWRGRPLVSREVVVNLIGCTTTEAGLHIRSQLDENTYEAGLKVSTKSLLNWPSSGTSFMVNGITACAPARSLSQHEVFKLFLLGSLISKMV